MKTYVPFTEEQKRRANEVDLEEFLRLRGERLLKSGPERRMASDHSVTIRGSRWYDHAQEKGGGPVGFVQTFYGLSYPEAVSLLLRGEQGQGYPAARPEPERQKAPFALPPPAQNNRRVFAYLAGTRRISPEVLRPFLRAGLIYEDAQYHNAVFVGTDEHGVPRHAHKRSTNSAGKSVRLTVAGSDFHYAFHWKGTSDTLYAFEAPIDLLSFLTLHPEDWQRHSYVACCGVASLPVLGMLERDTALTHAALCFDNDPAGKLAADRMGWLLEKWGLTTERLCSLGKDWNEDLVEEQTFQESEMKMDCSF